MNACPDCNYEAKDGNIDVRTLFCMERGPHLILQMNDRRAPMLILADDCWLSFFTVPVFRSNILPLKANTNATLLLMLHRYVRRTRQAVLRACVLDLWCCSLLLTAAPWASPCRLGAADHRGRSQTSQIATGWGRASRSPRRKRCVQFRMKPQTESHLLPPILDVSAPMRIKHNHLYYFSCVLLWSSSISLSWLLVPGRWEMRVCTTHPSWYSHSLSEISYETQPFSGWLVCLVCGPVRCRWAPCRTILWCRPSSCFFCVSQSRCGSLWREEMRTGGRDGAKRDRDGGNRQVDNMEYSLGLMLQCKYANREEECVVMSEIMNAKIIICSQWAVKKKWQWE